jgi:molecular chaperone HtpG
MNTSETGKISVDTENIFPIIKKWLYSEKDIFIRELVSNACDAIAKLKKISLSEEFDGGTEYRVDLTFNQTERTLTISDNGLGMTEDEIKKYINQIAFSGANEFAKKYSSEENKTEIIGHFGLGFYSSFMVSNKVEILSKSYKKDSKAVHWVSESGIDFSISTTEKDDRGTRIILHLDQDSGEYLDKWKLKDLIKRYCDFLPVPIHVESEQANKMRPLWSESPASVKDEDYKEFYNYLFPFSPEPLFHIHLNVDYPFRLQGILYFPKITHELEASKNGVKLYCNHVFVSDESNELIPQFLTILKGTIDIPDLPLNVSRSYLQNDPLVKKISAHIIKKIGDKLTEDFKKDRASYERNWHDISIFVKYGVMMEEKFFDSVKDSLLFKTSNDSYATLNEYNERNQEKNNKKIFYANETEKNSVYMDLLKAQGLEAVMVDSRIDSHFIQFLEGKNPDWKFQRVDSELADQIVDSDEKPGVVDQNNKTPSDRILDFFTKAIGREGLEIKVSSLKSSDVPAVILLPEYIRRMSEMNTSMNSEMAGGLLKNHTLTVNSSSTLVRNAIKAFEGVNPAKGELLAKQIYDLALLASKVMTDQEMGDFTKRTVKLLEELTELG